MTSKGARTTAVCLGHPKTQPVFIERRELLFVSPLTAFFFFFITFLYSEKLHHRNIAMEDQINQTTALKYSIPLLLLYIGNKLSSQSHQSLWVVQIQGPYSRNVLFLTSLTSQTRSASLKLTVVAWLTAGSWPGIACIKQTGRQGLPEASQ